MKKWKHHQRTIKEHLGNDVGTAEALMGKIRSTFSELDTSGDGFIDYSELKVVSSFLQPLFSYLTSFCLCVEILGNGSNGR